MKKLILSLIFPIINIVVSLAFIVGFLNERTPVIWNFWLCLLAGGVLPIILTLKLKIDTSKYIVYRLIFLIVPDALSFLSAIVAMFTFEEWLVILILGLPVLALIASFVFFIKKFKDNRERLILFLSNSTMYYIISLIYFAATFSVLTGL